MKSDIKIIFYAINGFGLGHLRRTIILAKEIRKRKPSSHILFLTNSKSTRLLENEHLEYVQLPIDMHDDLAKYNPEEAISYEEYISRCLNTLDTFSPDVIVYDNNAPSEIYSEAKRKGIKNVLIWRKLSNEMMNSFLDAELEKLFDLIILPHTEEEFDKTDLQKSVIKKIKELPCIQFNGPIVAEPSTNIFAKSHITRKYGIKPDDFVILATFGGGGHPTSTPPLVEKTLQSFESIKDKIPNLKFILNPGPYFKDQRILEALPLKDKRFIFVEFEDRLPDLMAASNLIISQSGYNAIYEIILAKQPSIIIPITVFSENQEERCNIIKENNAGIILKDPTPEKITDAIMNIAKSPKTREKIINNLSKINLNLGNQIASDEILKLVKNYNIKIWSKCNNNCIFCDKLNQTDKNLEEIKDEIKESKEKGYSRITFPCNTDIHPSFFEILKYAKEIGLRTILETNARIMSYDKFCEESEQYVDLIRVIYPSENEEDYETITATKGTFKQVLAGRNNLEKYNYPFEIESILPFEYPKILNIKLSYKCNSKCIICNYWDGNKWSSEELNLEQIKSIIPQAKEMGIRNIRLSGGEPTISKILYETIVEAKKNDMIVSISTNGSTLHDKNLVNKLQELGVNHISISLDSHKENIHDKIRGTKDLFKKVIKSMENITSTRIKLSVNIVITKLNYYDCKDVIDLISQYNPTFCSITQIDPFKDQPNTNLRLDEKQMGEFYFDILPKTLKEALKHNILIQISPFFTKLVPLTAELGINKKDTEKIISELEKRNPEFKEEIINYSKGLYGKTFYDTNTCSQPSKEFFITPLGEVLPCCKCLGVYKNSIGNINENSLQEIWDSDNYKSFKNHSSEKDICKQCKDHFYNNLTSTKEIKLPILLYHGFSDKDPISKFSVTPEKFEFDIKEIIDEGYTFVGLEEKKLPLKPICLTIDDGFESIYKFAFPILKKYNIPATIFISTSFIGKKGFLNWKQIKEMSDTGLSIQSHGVNHCWFTEKYISENNEAYLKRIKEELQISKKTIEENIGKEVKYFVFPYEEYNKELIDIVKKTGYTPILDRITKIQDSITIPLTRTSCRDKEKIIELANIRGINKIILSIAKTKPNNQDFITISSLKDEIESYRNLCNKYRIKLITFNIPECVARNSKNFYSKEKFGKAKQCSYCTYNDMCIGIPKNYLDEMGGFELSPIIKNNPNESTYYKVKPRVLEILATQACNLKCEMCFFPEHNKSPNELPLKDFKDIVKSAKDLGIEVIELSGGEPLLRKDIFEIIKIISNAGIWSNISTNGLIINKDIAEKIVLSGLNRIYISIDSLVPDIHDAMRGKKGAFKEAMEAIESLKEARTKHNSNIEIFLATVICGKTLREADAIRRYAKEVLNLDGISYNPFYFTGAKINNNEINTEFRELDHIEQYWILPKDYKILDEQMEKLALAAKNKIFKMDDPDYFRELKEYFRTPYLRALGQKCRALGHLIVSDDEGNILPCHIQLEETKKSTIHNIRQIKKDQGFSEIIKKISQCDTPCCYTLLREYWRPNLKTS